MVDNNYGNELAHVGIMGMKWGHHKSSSSSSSTATRKQAVAKVGTKLNQKKKKKPTPFEKPNGMAPKRLTDAQLRSRINRIEMDNKYATLTAKKINPAKKMITDILVKSAQTTMQAYVTKMMGKGMENFMAPKNPSSSHPAAATLTPEMVTVSTAEPSHSHQSSQSNYVTPNFRLLN